LMLVSRLPFAMMSTAALDPGTAAVLAVEGFPIQPTMPVVDFMPYDDTEGNDGDACKGVLYMRIQRSPSQIYHFFQPYPGRHQGSLMLFTTSHCRPAPDRLTLHCATVHSQHFLPH
jgi:hypothetical protein